MLNDHAIAELWLRRLQIGHTIYWMQAVTER